VEFTGDSVESVDRNQRQICALAVAGLSEPVSQKHRPGERSDEVRSGVLTDR
jgi:hypothetical protein